MGRLTSSPALLAPAGSLINHSEPRLSLGCAVDRTPLLIGASLSTPPLRSSRSAPLARSLLCMPARSPSDLFIVAPCSSDPSLSLRTPLSLLRGFRSEISVGGV
eukprot:4795450-Alexandrium_andersonii.AAC.3